jgi:uncharacterized protein
VIFIDTSAFLARFVTRDQYHAGATNFWHELMRSQEPCCTSNAVLSETFTLLARRTDYRFAARQALRIYSSSALQVLRPGHNDEASAVVLFEKYASQRVSFCDCISFVLMRNLGIQDVFTFDRDFAVAGFTTRP